ncbi:hypothetical protein B296_00032167 [Ensete ventricosum]|uniref:DUF4378 domain-containing protein n=1 Tax=Ensete ventricosum TaxID=4639 RepID=A0A426YEF4_ENSVE|nr:hypothetical protein B296_00032167 [Ensete ventricosum]
MMSRKPLMLKDYLELDWNSETSSAGFRCVPRRAGDAATVRCLLDAELRGGAGRELPRTRSMSAVISAMFNAVRLLPVAASGGGRRSGDEGLRSSGPSKRLRGNFWRRRGNEEESRVTLRNIVRLRSFQEEEVDEVGDERRSFYSPLPVVSSCSCDKESDSFSLDFFPSIASSGDTEAASGSTAAAIDVKDDSPLASPSRSPKGRNSVLLDAAASAAGTKVSVLFNALKLFEGSPISPPWTDRMGRLPWLIRPGIRPSAFHITACPMVPTPDWDSPPLATTDTLAPPPSSNKKKKKNPANVDESCVGTGTKLQLLQNIRRFESLANLDSIDIDRRLATSDDLPDSTNHLASSDTAAEEDEERDQRERKAWGLLGEVKDVCHVGTHGSIEKLLLDFFIQGLPCSGDDARSMNPTPHHGSAERPLLDAARGWIEGAGSRDLDDYHGEATLREMERNRRWRCFREQEEEVGSEVEGLVLLSLMEELVGDLLPY